MTRLHLATEAQRRFADDVLAWGGERPRIPPGLVDDLRSDLERTIARHATALGADTKGRAGRGRSIGRKVVERRVCDGWQLDPAPFAHGSASVRATLARDAITRDLRGERELRSDVLVDRVWHEAASRDPGDPRSRSAWMNRRSLDEVASLQEEIARLVDDAREVWPQVPTPPLRIVARRRVEVLLGGGAVTLFGVPDLVLESPAQDDRARSLVVDLRTGAARPERDRAGLRFDALLVTLSRAAPPFRWASYHVMEGRTEAEDLSVEALTLVTTQVTATIEQLARISEGGARDLEAGPWCLDCLRIDRCEVAAASRADVPLTRARAYRSV